jgi:hypothetical protein
MTVHRLRQRHLELDGGASSICAIRCFRFASAKSLLAFIRRV